MEFKEFNEMFMAHVLEMTTDVVHLFETDVSKDEMWETYLKSFPLGTNEIFRERREFDCNCCKSAIRVLGNIVAVKNGELVTVWDFNSGSSKYQPVLDAMANLVRSRKIRCVFLPWTRKIGTRKNYDASSSSDALVWYHLYAELSKSIKVYSESQISTIRGEFSATRGVLWRSYVELKLSAIDTVQDLIAQGSLYKGEEWEEPLKIFRRSFDKFWDLPEDDIKHSIFCWTESLRLGPAIARIRNHSIGVLLQDLSNGEDLNAAVTRYEKIVAPTNYKRPKPIYTKRMLVEAQKTVQELGFESSLSRRFARLEDITVPNILFADRNAIKVMTGSSVFEELAEALPQKKPDFDRVEEIPVDTFIERVLPNSEGLELYFSGDLKQNLVSLIAPMNPESPSMFTWNNGFSWAYKGNITDSMKERVKRAGGKVDGVLRFSIQWNDNGDNNDDLDAHCLEPMEGGTLIHFRQKLSRRTGGNLDVDIIIPKTDAKDGVAVENITWPKLDRMLEGTYKFSVHCYTSRGARSGFNAEIEFQGQVFRFHYPTPLHQDEKIEVATVTLKQGKFTLKPTLHTEDAPQEVWGLLTNRFYPVSVVMYSPNYWDQQTGIGHRHYMFMLRGCVNDEQPSGFFNEFLPQKLFAHRKVFEALSSKMRVADSDQQLSGLGFSSTKRNSVVVRVKGSFDRILRLVF